MEKLAFITGANRGIGFETAKRLAQSGIKVILGSRDLDKGKNALEKLKSNGIEADLVKYDAFDPDAPQKVFDHVSDKYGKLDILINNAGITIDNLSLRMKDEEWQKVLDINLSSTFYMCKFALKKMLKNKYGRIVNITSIVGHTGNLGQSNYSASKAGIVAFSKSLAIEYAKKNITVNCVSPGFIQTNMTDKISDSMKEVLTSRIPMNKLGNGEDVSNTVAFLASEEASYITGETVHVNGGMYMA